MSETGEVEIHLWIHHENFSEIVSAGEDAGTEATASDYYVLEAARTCI
jgi:hypothetical protein